MLSYSQRKHSKNPTSFFSSYDSQNIDFTLSLSKPTRTNKLLDAPWICILYNVIKYNDDNIHNIS